MSELSGRFFESDQNLLLEHGKEVRDFLDVVYGQIDHAILEDNNDGQLTLPINDRNISAVKWDTVAPQLPERLSTLPTFDTGEPVTIHARYRYGQLASMVNIWVSPHSDEHVSFCLGLRLDPRSGEVRNFGSTASSGHAGEIKIDEADTRGVIDAIFAANPAYQAAANTLGIADAFQLGIATQPDIGGEQYTVETAEKSFDAYSRTQDILYGDQFDLKVRTVDRTHPNNKPSRTSIVLRRHIEPVDYDADAVLDGTFEQKLEIVEEVDGTISSITRSSSVSMYDAPAVTQVNGKETVVTMASTIENDIPAKLAEKLYPTSEPTLEDLKFFQRLISQPIDEKDLYISDN